MLVLDLILFIFRRSRKHYLVPGESEDDAWNSLSMRQSMSIERCKKEYTLLGTMNANSKIWKV